ncbi:MAG: NADH-quinone oxidoreductase subunit J [Desulfonauticus sp.]|nr:NADH-quinone oxidoreductase subunit J [Desulfonauticus sp.]
MERLGLITLILHILIVVVGGFITVFANNIVRSLTGLILTLFGGAGLYFLMAAPFIGIMQVLIYVGAVSVIIFFAIAFTRRAQFGLTESRKSSQYFLVCLLPILPVAVLGYFLVKEITTSIPVPQISSVQTLGKFFLGPYVLPFELISLVLLIAMMGAVILGFEKKRIQMEQLDQAKQEE